MTPVGRAVAAVLIAVAVVVALPRPALAHASLTSTTPVDGAAVDAAPPSITLAFDQQVSLPPSAIRVFAADGTRVDANDPSVGPDGTTAQVGLRADLGDGTYIVTWRAVSADGHPVRGAFLFTVGDAGDVDDDAIAALLAGGDDRGWTLAARAARITGYAGGLVVAGAALFWALADPRRPGRRAIRIAATATATAWLAAVPLDAVTVSGLGIGALANATALGDAATGPIGRAAALTVPAALVARWLVGRADPDARWLTVAGLAVLAGFTLEGHTLTTDPVWLVVAADLTHLVAAAAWTGGLAVLLAALRDGRARGDLLASVAATDRFSVLAGRALAGVVLTGGALTWFEVRALRAVDTPYGWLLVAKIVLVAAVAALGAWNHQRLVPALRASAGTGDVDPPAGGSDGPTHVAPAPATEGGLDEVAATATFARLDRSLRRELALVVGVLAVTAALVNVQPAREAAGVGTLAIVAVEAGDGRELEVVVDPNRAGRNQVHLYLLDANGRPAQDVAGVELSLSLPVEDVGPIVRVPLDAGPGHWILNGPELSLPGTWEITASFRLSRFEALTRTVTVVVNP